MNTIATFWRITTNLHWVSPSVTRSLYYWSTNVPLNNHHRLEARLRNDFSELVRQFLLLYDNLRIHTLIWRPFYLKYADDKSLEMKWFLQIVHTYILQKTNLMTPRPKKLICRCDCNTYRSRIYLFEPVPWLHYSNNESNKLYCFDRSSTVLSWYNWRLFYWHFLSNHLHMSIIPSTNRQLLIKCGTRFLQCR